MHYTMLLRVQTVERPRPELLYMVDAILDQFADFS